MRIKMNKEDKENLEYTRYKIFNALFDDMLSESSETSDEYFKLKYQNEYKRRMEEKRLKDHDELKELLDKEGITYFTKPKPIIPPEATDIEVFFVEKGEAYIGYKIHDGKSFHYVQVPYTNPYEIKK